MADQGNTNAALEVSDQIEYMEKLRSAPIADFAKYLGVDIDTAVHLRVDDAVSSTYDQVAARQGPVAEEIFNKWEAAQGLSAMEVTVRPIAPMGNLYGFASVKIGGVTVDDFKIMESKAGELFAAMPSKPDKSSKTGYRNTVHISKEMREDFNSAIIDKYHDAVEQAQNRAANMRAAPDKPRLADTVKAAAIEAAKHNANLPPKEQNGKVRADRG